MYAILPQSTGAALGISVTGKLSTEDERALIQKADAVIAAQGKINLLVEIHDFKGATAQAIVNDLKWVMHNLRNISRLAVVVDGKIMGWLIDLDALFAKLMSIEEKHFTHAEMDAAWAWLKRPAA